jgi:hypothetical protein
VAVKALDDDRVSVGLLIVEGEAAGEPVAASAILFVGLDVEIKVQESCSFAIATSILGAIWLAD